MAGSLALWAKKIVGRIFPGGGARDILLVLKRRVETRGLRPPMRQCRLSLLDAVAYAILAALPILALTSLPYPAAAEEPVCRHAVSLVGAPKMPADFKHFDWAIFPLCLLLT